MTLDITLGECNNKPIWRGISKQLPDKDYHLKILLVYPQFPDTFWSFSHILSLVSKKSLFPPLGPLTVAAMLPGEWKKKLIDMNVTKLTDEDILWADYIFISAMQVQGDSAKEIISRCNRLNKKVVAGGPLFTAGYEDFDGVNHFVLGEAEITLPLFLSDLAKVCAKPIYISSERPDISDTPVPLWSLINMKDYAAMSVQFSRGCPFDCEFCDIVFLYGHRPRTKSTYQLVNELEALYSHGWRGQVFIVDDNFIGDKKRMKTEIVPTMIEWSKRRGFPFTFSTQLSIDLADDEELMRLMVEARFNIVLIGIETPNEESLTECNKPQNKGRDLLASVKKIQNHGIEVQGGFIIGFDSDTISIFKSQIDFIQKSGIIVAMVGLLMALRGTKLYNRLRDENRLLNESYGDNTDCSLNFIPKMNYETLIDGYKQVVDTIYSPTHYYERIHTFYREYQPQMKQATKLGRMSITSCIKALWLLGITENSRKYFWKLLVSTLFRYRRFFLLSIRFSMYSLHFSRFNRKIQEAPSNMQIKQLLEKLG